MLLLKILGAAAVLVLLLCMVRLQILLKVHGPRLTVDLRAGWIGFRVYPFPKRAKKEKEAPPEKETAEPAGGPRYVPTPADIRDALYTLPGPLIRSLRRVGKGIRIHPLTVEWIIGGQREPADAAERYGYLCAALWTFMPAAEKLVRIPDPSIRLDVDFASPSDTVRGEAGVSARTGTLIAAAAEAAVPTALLLLRVFRRSRGAKPDTQETEAAEPETDAEREDTNG